MDTSHINRWLTAAVALPLLILLLVKGGAFLFGVFITIVACIAFSEWNRITDENIYSITNVRLVPYFIIPFLMASTFLTNMLYFLISLVSIGLIIFISLKEFNETRDHYRGTIYAIAGFIYIAVMLSFVSKLRLMDHGIEAVFLLLFAVFASDTGAFYAGRTFGKNKLMPKVSPKKTIEGFAGGFLFSIFCSLVFKFLFFESLPVLNAVLCGLSAGFSVPLGDLFESMTKRVFDVKDSGSILPGHGGILDRIDGLLFAAPLIYIFISI